MFKIKTNLFIYNDKFKKAYPVIILDGNIKPVEPNGLPGCADERVNFRHQYAPTYADFSNNKVNTRFKYPYSRFYKAKNNEGYCEVYAKLNFFQRVKLNVIAKTSFHQKHRVATIFIILNILGLIPVWFSCFCPNQGDNLLKKQPAQQETRYNKVVTDSCQYVSSDSLKIDTLQVKERSIKQ